MQLGKWQAAARRPLPELPKELLDQLVKGPMTPAEVQDLMLAFNKAVIERAMGAEMNLHLGYAPGRPKPPGQANERNGASGKTVITDRGPVRVEAPATVTAASSRSRFPSTNAVSPASTNASLRCTPAA